MVSRLASKGCPKDELESVRTEVDGIGKVYGVKASKTLRFRDQHDVTVVVTSSFGLLVVLAVLCATMIE
jgi:hypothetical protein